MSESYIQGQNHMRYLLLSSARSCAMTSCILKFHAHRSTQCMVFSCTHPSSHNECVQPSMNGRFFPIRLGHLSSVFSPLTYFCENTYFHMSLTMKTPAFVYIIKKFSEERLAGEQALILKAQSHIHACTKTHSNTTYMHTYTYVCTHTHTHTHTHTCMQCMRPLQTRALTSRSDVLRGYM
jgi:hypothetical protein